MKLNLFLAAALALLFPSLCACVSAAGHACPPQSVPFDPELLQRTFIKLQSCPSNSTTPRTLFQVFERVLVLTPMFTPMEGTCPMRLVLHLRRAPALPFIVKLPMLMVNDTATCTSRQMAMRSRYFLNGRTRHDFVHAIENMVHSLNMMKMGSCPTEMDNMMMMMMDDHDGDDDDKRMDMDMPAETDDHSMDMVTMRDGHMDMSMGADKDMDMDMDMDMGMMMESGMGDMHMTPEPSEMPDITPEPLMERVVFPELDSLLSFFYGLAYTQNLCVE